jgi:O-antigen ligase
MIVGLVMFIRWCVRPSFETSGFAVPFLGAIAILAIVGAWGVFLALAHANEPYYLLADAYHWFVELVLIALITIWALSRSDAEQIVTIIAIFGLVQGVVGLITFWLAVNGIVPGAHLVPSVGIWRFDAIRGFPEFMLIPVTAALIGADVRKIWLKGLLWLAFASLIIILILTLKRTLWVSYALAVVLLLAPRLMTLLIVGTTLLFAVVLIEYSLDPRLLAESFEFLTYNPNNPDSFSGRLAQIYSVLPHIAEEPLGHGFGTKVEAYWPRRDIYGFVHYIHNLYLSYTLQLGIGGMLVIAMVGGWFFWRHWSLLQHRTEWQWIIRGGLASLFALAVNGLMLISTHTVFAGFVIGLGMVAIVNTEIQLSNRREPSKRT